MSETPYGLLPARFERWFVGLWEPPAALLSRLGVTPNALTFIGLGFGLIAGLLAAFGQLRWALLPLLLMGLCDILDGQVAKHRGQTSRFGAVLDSSLDRFTDFFLFCGLGIYFYLGSEPWWVLITALVLAGIFQVSYVKARAEGAGYSCPVGLVQRSERLILIAAGLFFGGYVLKGTLLVLMALSYYTAVERLLYLKKSNWRPPGF